MDENTIFISSDDTDGIGGYTANTVLLDLSEHSFTPAISASWGTWDFSTSNISITLNDPGSNFDGISVYREEQDIIKEHRESESLRARHPGVQAAWEQYQIMLNLARDDEHDSKKS